MAKGRRPPDIRNTLGSFVQSALEQVGVVRDVVERGAAAQRERYETVKLERERSQALAELGEAVYRLAVQDRLGPVAEAPELRPLLAEIDGLDQRIEAAADRGRDEAGFEARAGFPPRREAVASGAVPGRPARAGSGAAGEVRVWRPVPSFAAHEAAATHARETPPADDAAPIRVWRPSVDDVPTPADDLADDLADEPAPAASGTRVAAPAAAVRGSESGVQQPAATQAPVRGIRFDADWDDEWRDEYDDGGDDDLEEYMHEDDVPAAHGAADAEAAAGPDPTPAAEAKPRSRRRRGPRPS
jgi:hypothetical protein